MISEAKLRQAIPGLAPLSPEFVADLEARALQFIERQTHRYFGVPGMVTEYLQGNGSRHLRLSEPVCEADSSFNGVELVLERCHAGAAPTTIGPSAYQIRDGETTSYLVRLDGCLWRPFAEYEVTYPRGYAIDAGPKDIEQLLIDLIALRVKFLDKTGMRSESIGGYSYVRFGDGDLQGIDGAWSTINAWKRLALA